MAVPSSNNVNGSATTTIKRPIYPRGIPIKFTSDGEVVRYPGNTTVCHIQPNSTLQPVLQHVYNTFKSHPQLGKIARLVPQESWHMTVCDGVRETECEPGMWPEGLEKQPLDVATNEFSTKLRKLGLELEKDGLAPPYRMRVRGFGDQEVGCGLEVEGATPEEEQRMRRLRDRLADTLGFRAPNHETYPFHVTIAYWLRHVTEGEYNPYADETLAKLLPQIQVEFDLGAVEFCTFENMCSYPRQFYLGEPEQE